jgi:hypothetical protein
VNVLIAGKSLAVLGGELYTWGRDRRFGCGLPCSVPARDYEDGKLVGEDLSRTSPNESLPVKSGRHHHPASRRRRSSSS